MDYAWKTLKPGFFWYAIDTNLFRLGSTNPKKKFPDPVPMLFGGGRSFFFSTVFKLTWKMRNRLN